MRLMTSEPLRQVIVIKEKSTAFPALRKPLNYTPRRVCVDLHDEIGRLLPAGSHRLHCVPESRCRKCAQADHCCLEEDTSVPVIGLILSIGRRCRLRGFAVLVSYRHALDCVGHGNSIAAIGVQGFSFKDPFYRRNTRLLFVSIGSRMRISNMVWYQIACFASTFGHQKTSPARCKRSQVSRRG